jgi:hypothetical protein
LKLSRIRFRQSGGFAGLVRGCDVPGDELTASQRRALSRHLSASGGTAAARGSGARDLLVYEIEVETDGGTIRLEFDEADAPQDLADLIEHLQSRSAPMRP